MIVLNDDEDQSISKLHEQAAVGPSGSHLSPHPSAPLLGSRPSELPLRAEDPETQPPPAYPGTGYQTFPQPPPRPSVTPRDSLPPPVNADRKQPERRTWRRFVRALVIALILYALLSILFQGFVGNRVDDEPWDGGRGWPLPPNGRYEHQSCARFQGNRTEFALDTPIPSSADGLFFVTHGDQSVGAVHFKYDELLRGNFASLVETNELDKQQQRLLAQTTICVLKTGNAYGIGISTPSTHIGSRPLEFTVTFSLPYTPSTSRKSTRRLRSIKSNAPNYRHTLEIPRDRYFVEEVDLRSSNMPITSTDISGASISLKTNNAHIEGPFVVNKLLKLDAKNTYVSAVITAQNDPTSGEKTEIDISTTNSPIQGSLLLESTANNGRGGQFEVSARSTNNPLMLKTESMPLNAKLTLVAKSTNSQVTVYLAPEFEGAFALATTNMPPKVIDYKNSDPTRRGRERNIRYDSSTGKQVKGLVSWSKDFSTGEGAVFIESTNSRAVLYV